MTARAKVATPFVQVIPEPLSDNPLPWLTAEWLRDGAFSAEATEGMRSLVRAPEAMSPEDRKRLAFALDASLGALRSTVSALQDSADTYSVRLGSPEGTAATRWASRSVEIGAGPLVDETLSAPQRAAVMAGLVFHEVGHVRYTRLINPARQRDWKGADAPTEAIVAKVSNIVEDVRTEALDRDAFPGLAPALDAVIRWVGDRTAREHPGTFPKCFDLTNREGRIEALVGVLRYSWLADFTGNEATAEYIREAMGRALVAPTVKAIIAVIRELSEWVLAVPSKPAEAPTEPTDDEDEDEGEDAQPVDGTGSGFDSDGEDEDEDPEGDESDGTEDEDAEDEDSDADDGEGDSDEGDESEGEGQSEGDDSEDGEDGTEGGSDGEDESEDGDESDEGSEGTEDGDEGDEDESGEDEGSESNGAGTRAPGERTEDEDGEDEGESTEDESERSHRPESEDAPGTGTLPAGCIGDEARTGVDEAGQTLADYAHSMARKVERARRYPSPNGEGDGIIVREREIVPPPPVVRKSHAPEAYISPDEGESIAEGSGDIVKARRVASKSKRKSRRSYAGEISVTTDRILIGQTLAGAISSARRGRTAPEHGCRSGRLDRSRLARVAQHDYRVFTREDQPSPERVRAHILIDASGSMADGVFRGTGYESTYEAKVTTAAQAARDLAVAIDSISWITARIYAHTTDWDSVAGGHRPYVVPLWRSGEDREAINGIFSIPGGNNFDGYAIAYVADDLLEERESREKPLVIVISDGMPAGLTGVREHTARTVDFYRARGVRIVAVSIDPTVTAEAMRQLYGDDVVAYDAHPAAFARNLAAVIGSSI